MNKENIKQVLKFGTVGVFNTLVDYAVFYIFISLLNADKSISQMFATGIAMCGSYLINKRWTFGEQGRAQKSQIVKFIITNIVSMLSTIVFMNLLHDVLKIHNLVNNILPTRFMLSDDMGVMLCKIIASCLSIVINFIGNKFWVFKQKNR